MNAESLGYDHYGHQKQVSMNAWSKSHWMDPSLKKGKGAYGSHQSFIETVVEKIGGEDVGGEGLPPLKSRRLMNGRGGHLKRAWHQ